MKYQHSFTADILKVHGEWCLAHCLGEANAPSETAHTYKARTDAISVNLALNETRRPL